MVTYKWKEGQGIAYASRYAIILHQFDYKKNWEDNELEYKGEDKKVITSLKKMDDEIIAGAYGDNLVLVWSLSKRQLLKSFRTQGPLIGIGFVKQNLFCFTSKSILQLKENEKGDSFVVARDYGELVKSKKDPFKMIALCKTSPHLIVGFESMIEFINIME